MRKNYREIISLPHHVSAVRERMSSHSRAAQFAPFSALVGYEDAVRETARITEDEIIIAEDECEKINERLIFALNNPERTIEISYFVRDPRKHGGGVFTAVGKIKSADAVFGYVIMENGARIPIHDIVGIS